MDKLKPETIISQASDAITREIDGQTIILTPEHGTVHELDETGNAIWSLCANPISIESMTDKIVSEYDVKKAQAETDIMAFLEELIELGVVITH